MFERVRERAQEEQPERERQRERVLAGEGACEVPAHDAAVPRDLRGGSTRSGITLEEEEDRRAYGEQRRCGTRSAEAAPEGVCGGRKRDRPERGHKLEGHVVRQDRVERDRQECREREVE